MRDMTAERQTPRETLAVARFCFCMTLLGTVATMALAGTPPPNGTAPGMTAQNDARDEAEIKRLVAQQDALERQARKEISALPATDPRRQRLAAMLAEISEHDRKMERTVYIHEGTSDENVLAYQVNVQHRMEWRGSTHFPVDGERRLYGDLVLFVSIDKKGQLESVRVAQSSGQPALDECAVAIVREAGPYEPFGDVLRGKYDAIVVTARLHFAHEPTERRESSTSP